MNGLPQYAVWRIRLGLVLSCIATAAVTIVICAETVDLWRTVMAGGGALFIGLYCGLWLSLEVKE